MFLMVIDLSQEGAGFASQRHLPMPDPATYMPKIRPATVWIRLNSPLFSA
jgi:hypothetical protein